MELNGINSSAYIPGSYSAPASTAKTTEDTAGGQEETAAVYEKSEAAKSATYGKNSKVDQATIDQLKADAEERYAQLASLVEKLMTKQSETSRYATLGDLMKGVANGEVEVDPEVVKQAKKDVADDGYWGVEQTAERIVSFAKALTGGDAGKVEQMRSAIEKGYKDATKTWGSELPEISSKTRDRVNELLDEWSKEASQK